MYASCLTFYDRVPPDLCAKHEDLLGAVALKALCLLSRRPYLASSQQVCAGVGWVWAWCWLAGWLACS